MRLDNVNSHYVERKGVRLHHLDWGNQDRPTVVMVHGSRLHAHVWNDFGRRFRDRFHIVAVDQRGHGDSAWCQNREYELEDFYADLRAVIETRNLKRFTLVGHSLGGRVSMMFAARHPELLERLVLVDITAGRPENIAPNADMSRIAETPPPRDFVSHEDAIEYLGKLLARAPKHMVEESVRQGMREVAPGRYTWKYDPALAQSRRATPPGLNLWDMVRNIQTPTLLQYGSVSNVVTPELAAKMAATMPSCKVDRIENAGHALFTDQPDAFAESMKHFLGER
jgi:esterase